MGEREIEKTSLLFDIPMNIYLTVFRFYLSLSLEVAKPQKALHKFGKSQFHSLWFVIVVVV